MLGWLCTLAAVLGANGSEPRNVIIIVVDDLGIDQLARYGAVHGPLTPNIDRLADQGVLFRKAYGNPVCSPTRATFETGRYSFRTGIGEPVTEKTSPLPLDEVTLPEMLAWSAAGPYASAVVGKWHLGNDSVGGPCAPILAGYSCFEGVPGNIQKPFGYFLWNKVSAAQVGDVCESTTNLVSNYATTETVDDALAFLQATAEPFLLQVAFHAPHEPLHQPPAGLYPEPWVTACCRCLPRGCFSAMVEALDIEIGRLLASLDPLLEQRTTIVLVGDNGSTSSVILPPYSGYQAKGTVFDGGIRVPLIVKSPLVLAPGREVTALVNTVDLFATVAELAGVDLSSTPHGTLDGISLVPYLQVPDQVSLREVAFAEVFSPNGPSPTWSQRAMVNGRFKLIESVGAPDFFYDLQSDPYELEPLDLSMLGPLALHDYLDLKQRLADLLASP